MRLLRFLSVMFIPVVLCDDTSAVTFNNVVTLGDSLLDDPDGLRSPVAAEHVAERLGVPLTKFAEFGATSADLILDGQHTQAAAQFGTGDLAMLWIGGNDFFDSFFEVAFGLFGFIDDLEANVDSTLATLRGAGMEVVVFNLPDLSNVPATDFIANYRDATEEWNTRLDALAAIHDVAVVDVFRLFDDLASDPTEFSLLGNTPIVAGPPLIGDCQFCVFADLVHPSSFAQGFIANEAIATINQAFDPTGTMPLDPLSIFEIAALADVFAGDFDGNNIVDSRDLMQWENDFGTGGSDADGDGDTDGKDFLVWQQRLGSGIANLPTSTIPEPAAATLALAMVIVYLPIRQRIAK